MQANVPTSYFWCFGIDWKGQKKDSKDATYPLQTAFGAHQTSGPAGPATPVQLVVGLQVRFLIYDTTGDDSRAPSVANVDNLTVHFLAARAGGPQSPVGSQTLSQDNLIFLLEDRTGLFGGFPKWEAFQLQSELKNIGRFLMSVQVTATGTDGTQRTYRVDPEMIVGDAGEDPDSSGDGGPPPAATQGS